MSFHADRLREFFNHPTTDGAADEIERLEEENVGLREGLERCRHQANMRIGSIDALKTQLEKVREIVNESFNLK